MVYEYKCDDCDIKFSETRPMSEYKEPAECPKCGKDSDRVLSATKFKTGGGGHKNIIR